MKVLLEMLDDAAHALSNLDGIDELRPKSRERLRSVLERIADEADALLTQLDGASANPLKDSSGREEVLERALAAMARDRHDEAKSILQRGAEEYPEDPELLNHLGLSCWESDEIAAAESAYARAMRSALEGLERAGANQCSDPPSEYLRALEGRALSLYRLEQFDRAVELFDTLATLAADSYAGCYYLAGEIRHLQGRPEDAAAYYEESPDEPSVHYNHGLALFELGELEEAARLLLRGFAANPHIAAELLDRNDADVAGPGGYLGSATYAEEFLEACSNLWQGRNEALGFLEDCFEHPPVQEYLRREPSAGADASAEKPAARFDDAAPDTRSCAELEGLASEVVEHRD